MKKIFIAMMAFQCVLLSSCSLFDGGSMDDHELCDQLMASLTTHLLNDDYDEAKKLFASKLYETESFDDDLQYLIEYYDGEAESIKGRVDSGYYSDWDYEEEHHGIEYVVVTNVDTFRFGIHYVERDSRSKANVGIRDLYVLKLSEDEYPDDRYVGNLYDAPDGIYVAFPHMLPEEDL